MNNDDLACQSSSISGMQCQAMLSGRCFRVNQLNQLLITTQDVITKFGLNLITAALIFVIGRWVAKILSRFIRQVMSKSRIDPTIVSFTGNISYYGLVGFVVIAALNRLGVETASMIAVLGAASLAIGLALQGSLANLAAGVLLVIFRPFKVGDYIEVADFAGFVEDIQILTTTIVGLDNTVAIVPNASISSDKILNYTQKDIRRVDRMIGISYADDIAKARRVILEELARDQRILSDPAPQVVVSELGDSSVNLDVRPWVHSADYWPVYNSLCEAVKIAPRCGGNYDSVPATRYSRISK